MIAFVWFSTPLFAVAGQIYLGPGNSGDSSGGSDWLTGANGGGVTTLDWDDPPTTGSFDFSISNAVAGKGNNGDWRCPPFSLGPAASGARSLTFSFAYKLVSPVAKGNNIYVQLRFFDATGTNFISQIVLPLGAHTADSQMADYKTRTIENIPVPRRARTADIWIDANIFEPWVSGVARFGNFSVTTVPRSLAFKAGVAFGVLFSFGALIWISAYFWQRSRPS
ncbi:MAG TPA: hypothetical protein VGN23_03305 [Verrucomicrobiae bacterium]|jgi:hypothetical protein